MKEYVKPTIEIIELRPEERLASCGQHIKHANYISIVLAAIFGWCTRCKWVWKGASHCS